MEANDKSTHLRIVTDEDALDSDAVVRGHRHKSIYLLPNAFTTAALFCAFFAIISAMRGEFSSAAIAIFCSMVLDGMDGRVARLTNTQSVFGEQYDSLADMVSFGVAPALIMYQWQLKDLGTGRLGLIVAFVYCVCGALRLARFNANISVVDKRYFQGLPSPSAAALIAGFVWLVSEERLFIKEGFLPYAALIITLFAGLSMITTLPYYSGKAMDIRHSVTFPKLLVFVAIMLAVISNPPLMLFALFVAYAISGYLLGLVHKMHARKIHNF
ncbi:CDP-diacylglycerol--serine O-phosphatidyltransferase [Hydromonas duriensis]|uniref:CDP-diacylglycerol--serine O-phosphatidyltransferase n=1 Tax=Hydromonas duriensis TaxID=1527608 RepID=A0A4R6YA85_9BURK|nr:CDP-diacylglycerol--serine O-phosphatidyltransferase [Hydromonas duriensis]TDR32387.1 CDP-diacylglycerol--serine O-phosphatidyltransferase [Hydromonas duriensis]